MKLIDKTGKTKTFYCQFDLDYFLAVDEFEHEMVSETVYAELCNRHQMKGMTWDDGSIMTPNEWVKCVRTIYSNFS